MSTIDLNIKRYRLMQRRALGEQEVAVEPLVTGTVHRVGDDPLAGEAGQIDVLGLLQDLRQSNIAVAISPWGAGDSANQIP
jgi:hypothetical protein